jgi:predicted P-loop ATPase
MDSDGIHLVHLDPAVPLPGEKTATKKARGNGKAPAWRTGCMQDGRGKPLPNLANAMLALRNDPAIAACFAYDEMLRTVVLVRALPGKEDWSGERPVTDVDVGIVQEWLQHAGIDRLGKDTTHQAVDQRAHELAFHPVRDWLTGLVWDGQPRLEGWLADYLGADRTTYAAGIGRMFMVSMVARIFEPGCKADYMLILEGCRNVGTVACRGCRPQSLHYPDRGAVSAAMGPQRGERAAPVCVYRHHQQAGLLRDETGGRRFWPVKVGKVKLEALERDRDQLFAEAVCLFQSNGRWWPDAAFEREHIQPEQDARFEADAWEDVITDYLIGRDRVSVGQVAKEALSIDTPKQDRVAQNRIIAVLDGLRWQRVRDSQGRGYVRPPMTHDAQ